MIGKSTFLVLALGLIVIYFAIIILIYFYYSLWCFCRLLSWVQQSMSQFSNQQHPRYVLERNWSHLSLSVQDEQLLMVYWVLYNIFLLHLSWNGKEESFFQSLKSGQPYHEFGSTHEANLVPCWKTPHTKCIGCKTSMVFLNVRGVSFLSWITHLIHPV